MSRRKKDGWAELVREFARAEIKEAARKRVELTVYELNKLLQEDMRKAGIDITVVAHFMVSSLVQGQFGFCIDNGVVRLSKITVAKVIPIKRRRHA